jgi:hypothetical protein
LVPRAPLNLDQDPCQPVVLPSRRRDTHARGSPVHPSKSNQSKSPPVGSHCCALFYNFVFTFLYQAIWATPNSTTRVTLGLTAVPATSMPSSTWATVSFKLQHRFERSFISRGRQRSLPPSSPNSLASLVPLPLSVRHHHHPHIRPAPFSISLKGVPGA